MNKGVKVSGWTSNIITSRPKWSNFHTADRNGRAYLCNCYKRVIINNKPHYRKDLKASNKIKLYRSLLTGKLQVWD
jgi:hypothetical protein